MNKKFLFFAAICIIFASCTSESYREETYTPPPTYKEGDGNLTTAVNVFSAFERVNISDNAVVRSHISEEYRVVITIDENLHEFVETVTEGGTLYIRTRGGYSLSFTQFKVDIYAPDLKDIVKPDPDDLVRQIGDGNLTTIENIVSAFRSITTTGTALIVSFHTGEEYRVVITTDENLHEFIEVETRDNRLFVETRSGYSLSPTLLTIRIYSPSFGGIFPGWVQKEGNGNIITSEETISAFQKINAGSSATVRFHASDEFRVVVAADENLREFVEIETRDSILFIGTRSRYSLLFTQFIVDVYAPTLSGVRLAGSGNFEKTDKIIVPEFEAIVSGSGSITGRIESDEFSARISGSGGIKVVGSSQKADINISGSGHFFGSEFITNTATARISGSGNLNIHVTDNLNVSITGSGNVNYWGNPIVDSRITGTGRVNRRD